MLGAERISARGQMWLMRLVERFRKGGARDPRSRSTLSAVRVRSKYLIGLFSLLALTGHPAQAVTVSVVGSDGAPIGAYRWLLQEDTSKASVPGAPAIPGQSLSLSFHSSYAPVVATGHATPVALVDIALPDPTKRYFISVLPDSGYSNGGAQLDPVLPTVVTVNKLPLPTAQISVMIFEDNFPINNAHDAVEAGLGGFTVQLFEAGGSYGANGGRVIVDIFGNPLGTTYNANGSVAVLGNGVITTDATGVARIKNLAQGKYTIFVSPPSGQGWVQTATIEGTPGVDAWVKANEPAFFQEFGPAGHHVIIGFTKAMNDATVLTGGSTITGRIVNQHMSRSPDYTFYNGGPVPRCWIGLNEMGAAAGKALFAAPCNADSTFSIPNVPAGRYQLVIWDEPLDVIFASHMVDVPAGGGDVALMDVPVFNWFGKIKGQVFYDTNENGFPDAGEIGIKDQAVNVRFRDGSIYQMLTTDTTGGYDFEEVFPFFSWLVAEVGNARFKPTGVTVTVDAGGPIDPADPWSFEGVLNPQAQSENLGLPYRTETGPVLREAVQTFLGQTNVMQWGKKMYDLAAGENGGISGMVHYATMRAEDDPRYAVANPAEPGIPNVTVNLYRDFNADGIVDDVNGDGVVDSLDIIQTVTTDSFDSNIPTNCQGDNLMAPAGVAANQCFDGLRNFNQVRPGVFDGSYAFGGPANPLAAGTYIVEAIAPPGYEHVKEEDKNVDFGDSYIPSPLALPAPCVGAPHLVPAQLSLFPSVASPFANQTRPLCDRKQVKLAAGQNAAANFFLFTEVPVAGQIVGMMLNDLANEFDPNAPNFGEKLAPAYLPVSIRDWTGREISRVYGDAYGRYNALVPSTYTVNAPMPSGVSPNMLTACLNSPAKADGTPDPWFDRHYSQFCYTFQYMPGKTTYLDTPVLPVAAMTGPGTFPLDCEYPSGTPMIHSVTNAFGQGPWISSAGQTITITSLGQVEVPNPAFGAAGQPRTIFRDYGFGSGGAVAIRTASGLVPLANVTWSNDVITGEVTLAGGTEGQLVITRSDTGRSTVHSVTVLVGGRAPIVIAPNSSIQAVIDAPTTLPGDTISVPPGLYEELLVMHKPVRLQGWGAGGTILNAIKVPADKLQGWRDEIAKVVANGWFDLLPGQQAGAGLFATDEGAGITVLANMGEFTPSTRPRIDGFTITGADQGGAIYVNGYASNLLISNNRIVSNYGFNGGGIHVGNAALLNGTVYTDNDNDNIRIVNNQITQNGSQSGAGGGISLYNGTTAYEVTNNFICGNFAMSGGGGIGHLGVSDQGKILGNAVIFNESFNQAQTVNGGGILIAGLPTATGLTEGSGNVTVAGNLIQGNLAGAGNGGGIQTQLVNGQDVAQGTARMHVVTVVNNVVVNNVAGLSGGGVSLHDTLLAALYHNTIANNDSTATAGDAFAAGSPNMSTAQPAGVVAQQNSAALNAAIQCTANCFSNPTLVNNIVWHNRSFYWAIDNTVDPPAFGLYQVGYADLAVAGDPSACLSSNNGVLTPGANSCAGTVNVNGDPMFLSEYFNVAPGQTVQRPEQTTFMGAIPALDEGGNFIDVNFGPLTLLDPATGAWYGNYHIGAGSSAIGAGTNAGVKQDFDNQPRPMPAGSNPDVGADEVP